MNNIDPLFGMLLVLGTYATSYYVGKFVGYNQGRKDARDLQTKLNRGN
jgi:hypothetical protein